MKKIILVLFCLTPVLLLAQPQSDALFEKVIKEYTLNEDGSIDFHYYKKVKLLTHFSFNRLYGETFIIYNPEFQKLTINKSFTTQENGNVVQTPANAFNELLPRFAANAPAYNHLREMAVTHTGLELNAVVELDYTIHSEAGYYPGLMAHELITESSPLSEKQIIVHIPADQELYFKVFNVRTGPKITDKKGIKTYVFTFKGIAEGSHEPFRASYHADEPVLNFSTLNMEEVYEFLSSLESLNYKADESMKSAIAEIKKESKSDLQTILAIQKIVVNDLNNYRVPFEYASFDGRPGIEVWQSNGGTEFEKTVLLSTLLLDAGINAEPIIAMPKALYDEKVGCLNQIVDFAVQVNPRETEQIYLSATALSNQNMAFEMSNLIVIGINSARPARFENLESVSNNFTLKGVLSLDDSLKVSGKMDMEVFYGLNPYFKLKEDSAHAKKLLSGISEKDVEKALIVNCAMPRSTVEIEVSSKEPIKTKVDYFFYALPECKNGISEWNMTYLNSKRNTNLEVPFPISESYEITFTLPEGVTLVDQPEKIGRQTDFGKLNIEFSKTGNEITIIRSIEITSKFISVAAYEDFKEMIDLWNDKRFKQLILKK